MEENYENCIALSCHQDEGTENNTESPSDHGHVVLRHTNEKGDASSFTCPRDSLALLSVYRYARQIKSFLGWENILEGRELEGNNHSSSDKEIENVLYGSEVQHKENSGERTSKKGISDEIFTDYGKRNGKNSVEISKHPEERVVTSLKDSNVNSDHYESDFNVSNGTYPKTEIFRSEVKITVEDWRQQTTVLVPFSSPVNSTSSNSSTSSIITIMDKSLVEEDSLKSSGINLNDEVSILKDELHGGTSINETKCLNIVNDCVKFKDNILNAIDDCDTRDSENIDVSVKDLCETPDSKNVIKDKETEGDNNGKIIAVDGKTEVVRKSLITNVDKLNGDTVKEKNANNFETKRSEKIVKAHIQYENEVTKQPVSRDAICIKNQNVTHSVHSEDTECGFSIFRPRWLQPFATVKVYVILYSLIGVLHGSYYSYLIGTISTLEKRYAFKSKISGAIMVADEITPLLLGVIIGYYSGKANRPRMIALGMLLSAGCCFCSSLPYFIYGTVESTLFHNLLPQIGPKFCEPNSGKDSCDLEGRPQTLPAVLFLVVGSFLKGFGNLAYYAIGLAYLDDNSNKKTTPIYLAIALALRLLGPLVGFLMSSAFLKLYENPSGDPGYGPDDPRWIGAWWIGFFLQGVLLLIFTLPIALFPRRLPGQRLMENNTAPGSEDGLKQVFLGLFSALKRLGTNPVFVLLIVNTNMKIFGHFGHSIMLPKYMENQFRLSASEASLYSGATSITFVMLSTIFGGYLIWKFRPRIKVLLGGMIVSETILCIGFLILVIPRCQPVAMVNFGRNDEGLILNSDCNQQCDCSTTSYTPFCGPKGTTYFSPCYAGCMEESHFSTSFKHHKEFRNCSCLAESGEESMVQSIYEGTCPDEKCWSQALAYLITYFFLLSISNAFTVAASMILLRSVHPSDKSIALGTFETFICLFGFIPFPVTFGALVDSACLVWEKSCGETGNCWFYDMQKYSYLLHGVAALFCSFSVMCLIALYCLSYRVRDLYVDDGDEEKEYTDIKLDTVSGSVTKL